MTLHTNRNYVKPVFGGVPLVMMVLLGWFATGALQGIGTGQLTCCNGIIDGLNRFGSTWVSGPILPYGFTIGGFFCLTLLIGLALGSLEPFAMVNPVSFFAFLAGTIFMFGFTTNCFAFMGFGILLAFFQMALFAMIFITIVVSFRFVKFRKRFRFFASSAGFCYGLLRHNQFLTNWLCLELVARPILVPSSLYYSNTRWRVK